MENVKNNMEKYLSYKTQTVNYKKAMDKITLYSSGIKINGYFFMHFILKV